jgi:uncharacterized membrane protein (UPF0127 family)
MKSALALKSAVAFIALFVATAHAELPVVQLTAGMHVVRAELAADMATRSQGLMYRKALAPNAGMLFVFDEIAVHCMWMKNTLIPLSVAFVDQGGTIVSISDMEPHNEQSHCASRPALFALEMTRGWFAQRGIKPAMKLGGLERFAPRR